MSILGWEEDGEGRVIELFLIWIYLLVLEFKWKNFFIVLVWEEEY